MYYTHLYGEIRKSTILLYMVFDTIKNANCYLGVFGSWSISHTWKGIRDKALQKLTL